MKFPAERDFFLLARASLFRFRHLWMVFESILIEYNAQRIDRLLFGCSVPTIEFSAQCLIYTSHYCEQIQLIATNYDIKPLFFVAAAFNGISFLMSIYHVQVVDAISGSLLPSPNSACNFGPVKICLSTSLYLDINTYDISYFTDVREWFLE